MDVGFIDSVVNLDYIPLDSIHEDFVLVHARSTGKTDIKTAMAADFLAWLRENPGSDETLYWLQYLTPPPKPNVQLLTAIQFALQEMKWTARP